MAIEKKKPIELVTDEEDIEIEVDDQESEEISFDPENTVLLDDGSAVVNYEETSTQGGQDDFYKNLADDIDDSSLNEIATDLIESYKEDIESRQEWLDSYTEGLDLLGTSTDDRSEPFRGASGVYHPLLAESATQFQSQAYKELLPPGGPVQTRIVGETSKEVEDQAERVRGFMNHMILDVMEEFDPELDQMLYYLPLTGSAFKKTYYDQNLKRPVSKFVPADDLVVSYTESNLQTCPRFTHVVTMPYNDLRKLQVSGFYKDVEILEDEDQETNESKEKIQEITGFRRSSQASDMVTLLEMHVDLDLEGYEDTDEQGSPSGIAIPYIVTVHEDSMEVLAIRRNYRSEDTSYSFFV